MCENERAQTFSSMLPLQREMTLRHAVLNLNANFAKCLRSLAFTHYFPYSNNFLVKIVGFRMNLGTF